MILGGGEKVSIYCITFLIVKMTFNFKPVREFIVSSFLLLKQYQISPYLFILIQ